jgi:hypothetical protein
MRQHSLPHVFVCGMWCVCVELEEGGVSQVVTATGFAPHARCGCGSIPCLCLYAACGVYVLNGEEVV